MAKTNPNLIYGLEDSPPAHVCALLALQHILLAASRFAYPVLVLAALGASPHETSNVIALSLVAGGVGTILMSSRLPFVGAGYLDPLNCGAAYLPSTLQAASFGSMPLVMGMMLCAGAVQAALGRCMHRLRSLFPPEVTGTVIFMIGFAIVPHSLERCFGLTGGDSVIHGNEVAVAAITLIATVGATIWGKGPVRLYSVLLGMGAGYAASWAFGVVTPHDLAFIGQEAWFALPVPRAPVFDFRLALILPFAITAVSNTFKTTGDLMLAQKGNDPDWQRPEIQPISRGVTADAASTMLAALLGGVAQGSSSSNIGMSLATGATSRRIGFFIGGLMFCLAVLPKFTAFFSVLPAPVLGGSLLIICCYMLVNGMQVIMTRLMDTRRIFLVGLSLALGMSVELVPSYPYLIPYWLRPLFSTSLTLATVTALLLNLLFRLGTKRQAEFDLETDGRRAHDTFRLVEEQGRTWGARKDVMNTVAAALHEVVELAGLHGAATVSATMRFDELRVDLSLRFEAAVPAREADKDASGDGGPLSGVEQRILASLADRFSLESANGATTVHMVFNH